MRILEELAKNFSNSGPCFALTVLKDSIMLDDPINRYIPPTDTSDILQNAVNAHYREIFDFHDGKFTYSSKSIAESTYYYINRDMLVFLKAHLACKAPTNTKLYKYIDHVTYDKVQQSEPLILLWKYIKPFSMNDNFQVKETNKVHANNVIAILEAMREKYEK